jgi:uncharacterized membrane protein
MPVLIFIVLVILIAQVGFWDTFSAIIWCSPGCC